MTFRKRMLPCALATLVASSAWGASIHGHLSSVVEYYDEPQDKTALPVYQYLLLHANNIADQQVTFRFYGRAATDLHDNDEVSSHLYYAYLEKRNMLNNKVDAKLGRHFVTSTAGAAMMDGLSVQVRNVGPVSFGAFGGGDVKYYDDYKEGDYIGGVKGAVDLLDKKLHLGISYVQKWDESEVSHKLYGFDATYNFDDKAEAYTELQFNYLADAVSYFLGGFNYHANPKWGFRGEYLYSLPVFSATSIYSVFAVSEYEELMGKVTYQIRPGLSAFGRYVHEMYQDTSNANVFEAGVEQVRMDRFSGYLAGVWRVQDEGQDLKGIRGRVAYLVNGNLQVGVGASVDVLERWLDMYDNTIEGVDETTSHRLWADATVYISKKMTLELKVEQAKSALWDYFHLGRVRLNYYF